MNLSLISLFLGSYLIATFSAAGIAHAADRDHLHAALVEQGVFGAFTTSAIATILGSVEIALAGIVVLHLLRTPPLASYLIYLVVLAAMAMSAYTYVLVRRGYAGACGCTSGADRLGLHSMLQSVSLALSGAILVMLPATVEYTIWTAMGGILAGVFLASVAVLTHRAWSWVRLLDSQLELEHALDY